MGRLPPRGVPHEGVGTASQSAELPPGATRDGVARPTFVLPGEPALRLGRLVRQESPTREVQPDVAASRSGLQLTTNATLELLQRQRRVPYPFSTTRLDVVGM